MEKLQKEYWERSELYKRRNPSHPVINFFANSKIQEIQKHIKIDKNTNLLEVGAGNGYFSFYFDKLCKIIAVDFSELMIELNPIENKKIMTAADLQFEDNSFDIVFESNMFHHISTSQERNKVLSEMKRVSKKHIVFIEPNRNNPLMFLFGLAIKEERPSLNFSLNYLKKAFLSNGLKVITAFSHGIITPNKFPTCMLPLLSGVDKKLPFWGMYNIVICEK